MSDISAAALAASRPMLAPVVVLLVWTMIMEVWLYATRIPAWIQQNVGKKFDPAKDEKTAFNKFMPTRARWVADNFNHLHEQPTCFYAVTMVLCFIGQGTSANTFGVNAAWLYVILRIIHSLWQCLINQIDGRFTLFSLSSCVLATMVGQATIHVLL